jgi:hypothetical protein
VLGVLARSRYDRHMNPLKSLVVVSLLAGASAASGAVSDIQVTVAKDPGGSVVYKGKLDAKGNFATSDLAPGNYAVVFTSKAADLKNDQLSLRVTGGKQKMAADGVEGAKLAAGGVAMKVEVAKPSRLSGNIVSANGAASQTVEQGNTKVKIVNGKRYYWMRPETGSQMGGRWVEESEIAPGKAESLSTNSVRELQSRSHVQHDGR